MAHPTVRDRRPTPRPAAADSRRRTARGPTAAGLALVAAVLLSLAHAQGAAFDPIDGALYAGEGGTGRPVLLSLYLARDGGAAGTLLEAPPPRGGAPGLDFAFEGGFERDGDRVVVRARARPRTTGGAEQDLEVRAPLDANGAALDPFASASVAIVSAGTRLEAAGVGTLLSGRTTLADGSLGVERRAPFFYADPWRTLPLTTAAGLGVDPTLRDGLAQRRDRPRSVAGVWWDRRYATVESFAADLVSVRVLTDVFSGGAHPNTWRATHLFRREGDGGWREVGPCEALATLDRPCDLAAIRAAVVAELRRQEAAWVQDGEVDEDTPWLLELVTLTPRGMRVEFDPYDVGPYVQGPFVVDLPFPLPAD